MHCWSVSARHSEQQWTQDSRNSVHALAERRPADRVESVEEAGTLAREGRVEELYVTLPDELVVDDDRRQINALHGAVVRCGGRARALRAAGSDDLKIVADLRW